MNKKYQNPALQEEPIGEPASIIAPRENESLFRWIKSTGRFMSSQTDYFNFNNDKGTDELDAFLSESTEKDEEE
jgi:hypothetical protein